MPTTDLNGARLYYELSGTGEVPLVLVHGSWDTAADWAAVVPELAKSFRVVAYDRRGHSRSRPSAPGNVRDDVDDLAALIEHLKLAPAWVVGNSFGAAITLKFIAKYPELLRGIIGHEPPLVSLIADDAAFAPIVSEVSAGIAAVVEVIASGDHAKAAEMFVDKVAVGPGSWATMPSEFQQALIDNAPTFLDEVNDPEALAYDLDWIRNFKKPAMLSKGVQSPPMFAPIVAKLAKANPRVEVYTFTDAGHIPHATAPATFVDVTRDFIHKHAVS